MTRLAANSMQLRLAVRAGLLVVVVVVMVAVVGVVSRSFSGGWRGFAAAAAAGLACLPGGGSPRSP